MTITEGANLCFFFFFFNFLKCPILMLYERGDLDDEDRFLLCKNNHGLVCPVLLLQNSVS